jgi:murein DD-endopeptidase MepM/ murein hydrolase activator NlpD
MTIKGVRILLRPIKNLSHNDIKFYPADSGVDIAVSKGTEVQACANGRILYSEWGHTPWVNPPDTPGSILIEFDTPFYHNGKQYYYAWHTHMSELTRIVKDGNGAYPTVTAGGYLGKTGLGNGVPHLHFGILSNRAQNDGDFMPPAELAKLLVGLPDNAEGAVYDSIKVFYHNGKTNVLVNGKPTNDYFLEINLKIRRDELNERKLDF